MASAAAPVSKHQMPVGWISQEEQLRRLTLPEAEVERVLPRYLVGYVVEYATDPSLTNWHTALQKIGYTGPVPRLPYHIHQIMESESPLKPNTGRVGDTHVLYYDPPGTLNELVQRVKACAKKIEHPKAMGFSWSWGLDQLGDVPSEGGWVLISKDILEESRGKTYDQHVAMIGELNKKSFIKYEVPKCKAVIAACFLHNIATGQFLFPKVTKKENVSGKIVEVTDEDRTVYTCVEETVKDDYTQEVCRLKVGAYSAEAHFGSGLELSACGGGFEQMTGVAAVVKLEASCPSKT
jgi:hypothetical protein